MGAKPPFFSGLRVGVGLETAQVSGQRDRRHSSELTPPRAQQLAVVALDHLQSVAHEAMRLVAKRRVLPVGGANQPPTEQGGRDFKMGCLLFAAIQASQHEAKASALGRSQSSVGNVLPMDRADEPLDRLEPVVRHVVERDDGGKRFAWLRVVEKRQLRAARRRARVKTDLVMPARGQRNGGSTAFLRSQSCRNLDKIHDPRIDLRRPIDGLLYRGLVGPGCEIANPSACATRASPWLSGMPRSPADTASCVGGIPRQSYRRRR